MAFNIFKKEDKKKKKAAQPILDAEKKEEKKNVPAENISGPLVLSNFYISEKANNLMNLNQYVFRVTRRANKSEIRKQVEKTYKVKVTRVNIVNMPEKSRNVGRHAGIKPGFKKAIVTLAEGDVITAAKP